MNLESWGISVSDKKSLLQQDWEGLPDQACPGVYFWTGLQANSLSQEERQWWDEHQSTCPSCCERWNNGFIPSMELVEPNAFMQDLLHRSEVPSLPPVPDSIWEQTWLKQESKPSEPVPLSEPVNISVTSEPTNSWFSTLRNVWNGRYWLPVAVSAVVALLLFYEVEDSALNTSAVKGFRPKGPIVQKDPPGTRLSLSVSFKFFHRRLGKQVPKHHPLLVKADDQLRFAYTHHESAPLYLLLFLLDAKGKVSRLYPNKQGGRFRMSSGRNVLLPDGIEFDSSMEVERIFVCVSRKPLHYNAVVPQLQRSLEQQSLSTVNKVPADCVFQKSWILQKVAAQ